MYLLPAIDILGGKAVRLAKGDYNQVTVYNDDPVAQARAFEAAGAQWVHVVDLDGARTGVPENIAIVERIVRETSLQVEIGGGIRSLETLQRLADVGAARMVLGTALVNDPDLLVLDEPTSGMDAESVEAFVTLLQGIVASRRRSVLLVTHDTRRLSTLGARVVRIEAGRLYERGAALSAGERQAEQTNFANTASANREA